jgi:hypothetical protein
MIGLPSDGSSQNVVPPARSGARKDVIYLFIIIVKKNKIIYLIYLSGFVDLLKHKAQPEAAANGVEATYCSQGHLGSNHIDTQYFQQLLIEWFTISSFSFNASKNLNILWKDPG